MLAISLLGAFILAIVLSFLVSILISKPLRELSWLAKSVAKGHFLKSITIQSKDEIGDLAKAFNEMSAQIEQQVHEVTVSKSRLEAVLLSMSEGVMVVDMKGMIL